MDLPSSVIRSQSFPQARRGYDVEAVDAFLSEVADAVERYQAELTQARESEEAVKLTFVAAAQAKQDLIEEAKRTSDAMIEEAREETATARQEAQRIRHKAQQSAEEVTIAARAEALELLTDTRSDAEALTKELQADHRAAVARVEAAQAIVERTKEQLVNLAHDASGGLDAASEVLKAERASLAEVALPSVEPADEFVIAPEQSEAAAEPDEHATEPTADDSHLEHAPVFSEARLEPALVLPETADAVARPAEQAVEGRPDVDRQGELLSALQSLTRG